MKDFRSEMKGDIKSLRSEMKDEHTALAAKLDAHVADKETHVSTV
jgi:hypothetical protein